MKICYVVLHYQAEEMTKSCVDQLLYICGEESKIIIVDNASPNKSGLKIKTLYESYNKVTVLLNTSNLGFAEGNNVGYRYAKNIEKAKIIVSMNNDVLIEQIDFEQLLENFTITDSVHVIAPDIINKKGEHQNPLREDKMSTGKFIRRIVFYILVYISIKTGLLTNVLLKMYSKKSLNKKSSEQHISKTDNIIPHGACVIYTQNYINNEEFAFVPITFMYVEEDILFDYIKKKGYRTKYNDKLTVIHIEDVATDLLFQKTNEKEKFCLKNRIYSMKQLLIFRTGLLKLN